MEPIDMTDATAEPGPCPMYIDRVTEGEPPLPGVRNEVHERVGQVGVSYISGPDRRGPRLDLGEPLRDPYQFR